MVVQNLKNGSACLPGFSFFRVSIALHKKLGTLEPVDARSDQTFYPA